MIDKLSSLSPLNAPPSGSGNLKESAQQFEALLIGQMLKSVRESGGSWMGGGEDEAASSAIGMAEEHLAHTLAAQGGLGLTAMVMQGLAHDEDQRRAKGSENTGNSASPRR